MVVDRRSGRPIEDLNVAFTAGRTRGEDARARAAAAPWGGGALAWRAVPLTIRPASPDDSAPSATCASPRTSRFSRSGRLRGRAARRRAPGGGRRAAGGGRRAAARDDHVRPRRRAAGRDQKPDEAPVPHARGLPRRAGARLVTRPRRGPARLHRTLAVGGRSTRRRPACDRRWSVTSPIVCSIAGSTSGMARRSAGSGLVSSHVPP